MAIEKKYEELRDLILVNKEIRDLVKERDKTIDALNQSKSSGYYTLEPSLTPKGDINLPKEKRMSKKFEQSQKDKILDTRQGYDKRIYELSQKHFEKEGYNDEIDLKNLGGLNEKEIGILVEEDGVSKLIDYQKEKGLPTYLTDEKYEQVWKEKRDDFSKNKQDIDKVPRKEVVQFDHNQKDLGNKSSLDRLRMDGEKMDKFMSSRNKSSSKGKGKSKGRDKGKGTPDPSDNYE